MGLLAEIADRMDKDERLSESPLSRDDFRAGRKHTTAFGSEGNAIAQAVIEGVAEYEELKVREVESSGQHFLELPDDTSPAVSPWFKGTRTILMKKLAPEPTLEELAQRAVKEWEQVDSGSHRHHLAMAALVGRLDKS